jgi:hypothetical protein
VATSPRCTIAKTSSSRAPPDSINVLRWAAVLRAIPRPIRDFLYDRVARNRYSLFGKRDACLVPTPDVRSRFISELPELAKIA